MLLLVALLGAICSAHSSSTGDHIGSSAIPIESVAPGPVVTASSSQYFERTFNRLVAAPPLQPALPVAPHPPPVFIQPSSNALPIAPAPPHLLPAPPQAIPPQPQEHPTQPNVAIAVATAHAAAPVATILLPPYPFGASPVFGFVPSGPPANVPKEKPREQTTPSTTTTRTQVTTTEKEPDTTTPEASSIDEQFVQALPSNENVNFNQVYGLPLQRPGTQQRPQGTPLPPRQPFPQQGQFPQQEQFSPQGQFPQQGQFTPQGQFPLQGQSQLHNLRTQGNRLQPQHQQQGVYKSQQLPHNYWPQKGRPQKLKTSVEVVKVPLAYIAPTAAHTHEHLKVIKHVYSFAPPTKSKIIIRTIRTPGHIVTYRIPVRVRATSSYNIRPKDIELTTFRAFHKANTKVL